MMSVFGYCRHMIRRRAEHMNDDSQAHLSRVAPSSVIPQTTALREEDPDAR